MWKLWPAVALLVHTCKNHTIWGCRRHRARLHGGAAEVAQVCVHGLHAGDAQQHARHDGPAGPPLLAPVQEHPVRGQRRKDGCPARGSTSAHGMLYPH